MTHPHACRTALLAVILTMPLSAARASALPLQSAVWHSQELRFDYRGTMTLYDCDALVHKVRQILVALGAHRRSRVEPIVCHVVHLPSVSTQTASMRITVTSPVPEDLAKPSPGEESRRQLLAHLGVQPEPHGELVAAWQDVDVAAIRPLRLSAADCELLRQLRKHVLDHLAVRVVAADQSCSSSPHYLRRPVLKVAALLPAEQQGR